MRYDKLEEIIEKNECPMGGDSTNDCDGCAYSGDYHCVNGECVSRDGDDGIFLSF